MTFKKILLSFVILSSIATQAQLVKSILNSTNSKRTDTIINFKDGKNESYLPLTVIKGNSKGPVFAIAAGIHGYEYPPIVAVQELLKELDLEKLNGTLIVLPIANTAAFYKRSPFVNPIDGKNLNTAFPGNEHGSITEQIAHWISTEVIPNADVFLDIHGGDANEDLMPFICYYDNKNAKDKTYEAKMLSEKSGMYSIVSYPYNLSKTEPAKYAFKQAVQYGITALSIEAGKLATVQFENVNLIKKAVYNMLSFKKMYPAQDAGKTLSQKNYFFNQVYVKVPVSGIFYSVLKSGNPVTKGQSLGYITDSFGKKLIEITSPSTGTVLYKTGTPPVNKDETLFCIGY